ncbi:DUF393 domain-containing protein [Halobacteriovorax sp. GB3]|uniref:thiol-disulfide oxidoreductase DCC family protein n=1 Tax=Halobacteriovorax sp. GB3 TaxID=2719615 RepID=UPI0023614A72|nr:DUF393 domain-containing protein [Halobacteriovorax sp. GB3]MDD0854222.1 DUF393 domain-containing protein [Halobacteriovorax sp. GB3]
MDVKTATLFFDNECPLCLRFKQALERLPGTEHIQMISIHSEELKNFPMIDIEECKKQVHLLTEDNDVLVGQDVAEYLIQYIPGVSKFAWLLDTEVGKRAMTKIYRLSEKYRKAVMKTCPSCR